jgi:hypothetical protein
MMVLPAGHGNAQAPSSRRPQLELSDDGTCLLAPVESSDDRSQRLQVQTHKRGPVSLLRGAGRVPFWVGLLKVLPENKKDTNANEQYKTVSHE